MTQASSGQQPAPPSGGVLRAAGGLLTETTKRGVQLAVVHRRRYDGDWSLPKGKLEDGETWQAAALREVREETGVSANITDYAGAIGYVADGVPKVVLFWRMEPKPDERRAKPKQDGEVAEAVWLTPAEALTRLSYAGERRLVGGVFGAQIEGDARSRLAAVQHRALAQRLPLLNVLGFVDHGAERLAASLRSFEIELEFLIARQVCEREADKHWPEEARALLGAAWDAQHRGALDAGWRCFTAAQRLTVFGLDETERNVRASVLREEAEKLSSKWRPHAIHEALTVPKGKQAPDAFALSEAMFLRDEHSNNEYFKLGLLGSQLKLLSWILAVAVLLFGIALFVLTAAPRSVLSVPGPNPVGLDAGLVLLASLFGIIGAAFSAIGSTAQADINSRIPERLSGVALTFSRTVLGAPAALLVVLFLQTGLLKLGSVDATNQFLILVVAFAAGFSERLVVRAVESVAGRSERGQTRSDGRT